MDAETYEKWEPLIQSAAKSACSKFGRSGNAFISVEDVSQALWEKVLRAESPDSRNSLSDVDSDRAKYALRTTARNIVKGILSDENQIQRGSLVAAAIGDPEIGIEGIVYTTRSIELILSVMIGQGYRIGDDHKWDFFSSLKEVICEVLTDDNRQKLISFYDEGDIGETEEEREKTKAKMTEVRRKIANALNQVNLEKGHEGPGSRVAISNEEARFLISAYDMPNVGKRLVR